MLTDEYDYNSDMQAKMEDATIRKAVEDAMMLVNEYKEDPEIAAQKMAAPLELVLDALKKNE